jgi:hypothetical protein
MRQVMELAPTPTEERCEQVGSRGYDADRARAECRAFVNQLRRQFGEPPEGASLFIKSNTHDGDSYLEVAVRFDDSVRAAIDYAFRVERKLPARWDREALAEIRDFLAQRAESKPAGLNVHETAAV